MASESCFWFYIYKFCFLLYILHIYKEAESNGLAKLQGTVLHASSRAKFVSRQQRQSDFGAIGRTLGIYGLTKGFGPLLLQYHLSWRCLLLLSFSCSLSLSLAPSLFLGRVWEREMGGRRWVTQAGVLSFLRSL